MIIISGANGQLGRGIVEELLKRVPASQVGVSVRDAQKAQDLAARGVRVRQATYDDPDSLAQAFEGAQQVLIVSVNSTGEQALHQHRTALDQAVAAGAGRILYTSHVGASSASPFEPMRDHAATEAALRSSGVPFTVLRNGFYANTVPQMLGQAFTTGDLALPADGPISWTTHADLAEATAVLLTRPATSESLTVNLAGQAVDFQEVARVASEIGGRPVVRTVVTDDDFRKALLSRGLPDALAAMTLGIFQASRLGQFSVNDPSLTQLLGRAPTALKAFLTGA